MVHLQWYRPLPLSLYDYFIIFDYYFIIWTIDYYYYYYYYLFIYYFYFYFSRDKLKYFFLNLEASKGDQYTL